jgi:hypothetical protein
MRNAGLLATLAVVLALAGCGSGDERAAPPPRLPAPLASELASRSDAVVRLLAQNDGCGALAAAKALRRDAIAALNTGRIPTPLQEPLVGAANDLVIRIQCVPPAANPEHDENEHRDRGKGRDHGKGHGGGDHGGEG